MRIPGLVGIDGWLLRHLPNVWCLRAHYVIPGCLLACVLMAFLGPVLGHSIERSFDSVSAFITVLFGAIAIYWCYLQVRQRHSIRHGAAADFAILLTYPVLLLLILLPGYVFDQASGKGRRTVTGNDDILMVVTVIATVVMVGAWIARTFLLRTIVQGAIVAIGLSFLGILITVAAGNSDDALLAVSVLIYAPSTVLALVMLWRSVLPWIAAACMLMTPVLFAMWSLMNTDGDYLTGGYIASTWAFIGGMIACALYHPLLNRYRFMPR